MPIYYHSFSRSSSHPTRVRGLKFPLFYTLLIIDMVASHAGAWIEMTMAMMFTMRPPVASHAGAWIEIVDVLLATVIVGVASHAGAWIEIGNRELPTSRNPGRIPRGCVD